MIEASPKPPQTSGDTGSEPSDFESSRKAVSIFNIDAPDLVNSVNKELKKKGVVVIRGLLKDDQLENLQEKTFEMLQKPSICGSYGYYQKDHNKRLYDPLLLCPEAVDVVADERILDCMENFVQSKIILGEVFLKQDLGTDLIYFPVHTDFSPTNHWGGGNEKNTFPMNEEILSSPFAVGFIMYLEDTDSGCFCYSVGSHQLGAPHGTHPENYPPEMIEDMKENMVRVSGKAGDVVIFDDRGFHGPEQPSSDIRTVIIADYMAEKTFGKFVKSPAPVLLPFISHLNQRQLEAMGLGCEINTEYKRHHTRGFSGHPLYRFGVALSSLGFSLYRIKDKLSQQVKGKPETYLPDFKRK